MRKAAANAPETADLATAPADAEHREKYSMGHGYYLATARHSGWHVRKTSATTDWRILCHATGLGGYRIPGTAAVRTAPVIPMQPTNRGPVTGADIIANL